MRKFYMDVRATIIKTCRQIVKRLYSDMNERAEMLVSLIPQVKLDDIHGKTFRCYL